MNPFENGAYAAVLCFLAAGIVSFVANVIAGPSKIRWIGVLLVVMPVGANFFGVPLPALWIALSAIVGLLVIFWAQRTASRK